MDRIQRTIVLHRDERLNCAQAIITAFGGTLGIDRRTAQMLGRPWAGGIGHQAELCGYLSGAVVVLGKAFDKLDENQAVRKTDEAVQKLFRRFKERRQFTCCKDLLGADLTTDAGVTRILEENLVGNRCKGEKGIGKDVAEILASLM